MLGLIPSLLSVNNIHLSAGDRQKGEGKLGCQKVLCSGSPAPAGLGWSGVSATSSMSPFAFSPGAVWASAEQPLSFGLWQCQTIMVQRMGAAWERDLEAVVRNWPVVPPLLKRRGGERAS